MDTKWISSIKSWWEDYRLWTRSIENVFIIVFTMLVPTLFTILFGGVNYENIVKLNYSKNQDIKSRVTYRDALFDAKTYKECRLLEKSVELSKMVYEQTDYLKAIENAKTKEEKDKVIMMLQEHSTLYVGVVIINNDTGDYYSNRPWFYDPPYTLSSPKEVIEGLAKNNTFVYKIIKPTENLEEIYFQEGNTYNSEAYSIRISFILTCMTTFILIILLIKKIVMVKKMNMKGYANNLRSGYIFKLINSIKIILYRDVILEEVIKDRILWFSIFATCVYKLFYELMDRIDFWLGYPRSYNNMIYSSVFVFVVIHFILKFVRRYDELESIIENLNEYKQEDSEISLSEDKQLKELAIGINSLRDNYRKSVEDGIKNEKLKTELISNVSHDLKTPLTSIINYIDILQRPDITPDEKIECIKILETKSQRLKKLIDDLFEVSKMNSGKIQLSKYNIDIVQLVYQCIIEVEDVYSYKEMEFKVKAPQEVMIYVDPEKIARVLQNLFTNALKYGLERTRIYIEINETDNTVELSFKNIASYELSFDESEILERFVRGDKSRNSSVEGSGLGLAITKTIVELHSGTFKVECEGDLFKAFVVLPKWNNSDNNNYI